MILSLLLKLPANRITNKLIRTYFERTAQDSKQYPTRRRFYLYNDGNDPDVIYCRGLMIANQYEKKFIDLLSQLVQPDDIIIDVGANEGYISLCLAASLKRKCQIIAIEPHPVNVKRLRKNIQINSLDKIISVIPVGAGNRSDFLTFYGDGLWGTFSNNIEWYSEKESIQIPIKPFDDIIYKELQLEKLSFVKLDVEGFELQAAEGFKKALADFRPLVSFEVNLSFWANNTAPVKDLFDIFRRLGYELFKEQNGRLQPYKWLDERVMGFIGVPLEKAQSYQHLV